MECAICFDPIGLARVTLGCTHAFHLRCISGWFYQQNMNSDLTPEEYTAGETSSSCPCCRAAPTSTLDDIPTAQMIKFIDDDDDATDASSVTLDNPFAEEDELATEAAFNRAFAARADTPPPPSVPRLDLTRLEVRWARTGPTSWQREVIVEEEAGSGGAAAQEFWDGSRTASPPPDSLVEQTMAAARAIQTAFRAYRAS